MTDIPQITDVHFITAALDEHDDMILNQEENTRPEQAKISQDNMFEQTTFLFKKPNHQVQTNPNKKKPQD